MIRMRFMLPLIVLEIVCCTGFGGYTYAQNIKVTGRVVDMRNQNAGVAGIRVRVSRDGVTIATSLPSDISGNYSVESSSGSTITVAYGNSEWTSTPITNLSGTTNHTITRALVKVVGRVAFNSTESRELLTAAAYFKQNPGQYSAELAQVNRIDASLFPQEFRQLAVTNKAEGMLVAQLNGRLEEMESRVSQVEQNAQRVSGQLDELAATSNAARGGSKAAQETADAAVAGVNATNERISALDDYVTERTLTIPFESGRAELSNEAKSQLDALAKSAATQRGYTIEISGFTDASGSSEKNLQLSQQRAENVARYLISNSGIPVRRIAIPLGYGGERGIAGKSTQAGLAQNNRVEIRLLINRGLQQGPPQLDAPKP